MTSFEPRSGSTSGRAESWLKSGARPHSSVPSIYVSRESEMELGVIRSLKIYCNS